jgi:hypothetical protein
VITADGLKLLISLGAEQLASVLTKFGSGDLKKVLETRVSGKKTHDERNEILNDTEIPNLTKRKLTEILQNAELN